MHPIDKFELMVKRGQIIDGQPIPKKLTYRELEYLYNAGYITEINDQFIAVVPRD